MDLLPSPEQSEIIDVVGGFLADRFPTSRLRERAGERASFDAATWTECGELGWFALGLSEELGGVGYGMVEEVLVFRELGRRLAPGPFIATALGARLVAISGQAGLATTIASGAAPVALATPRNGEPTIGDTISGSFHVIDGPGASHYLVLTDTDAALVEAGAAGDIEPVASIDEGSRLARLTMDRAPVVVRSSGDDAAELWRRGTLLVSAMLTGVAEATRDLAAEYAKQRVQFGRPIGVNQAIKHACADMVLRAEAAAAQLVFAALSVDELRDDRSFQVASARVVATDAAIANASAGVQVHGGMGYTYEHDSNLYVKRARILDRMLGGKRKHLADVLQAAVEQ
ncbi:MAG: acyl-CoA dehydrogenase family protein [Acidimicrobiia bacterium]